MKVLVPALGVLSFAAGGLAALWALKEMAHED